MADLLVSGENFIPWNELNDWDTPFGQLVNVISDLSEEYICSGWVTNCEFVIWKLVNNPGKWGMGVWSVDIDEKISKQLLDLSNQCSGWPLMGEDGVYLIPIDIWRIIYNENVNVKKFKTLLRN